ncbi:unnamed protein product, partial [Allacma fusca]
RKINDITVYNSTNNENPYVCNASSMDAFQDSPSNQIFWYPSVVYVRNHAAFAIVNFFVHFIPAVLVDGILKLTGKKPNFRWKSFYMLTYRVCGLLGNIVQFSYPGNGKTHEFGFVSVGVITLSGYKN